MIEQLDSCQFHPFQEKKIYRQLLKLILKRPGFVLLCIFQQYLRLLDAQFAFATSIGQI